jgi:hypothetical protein
MATTTNYSWSTPDDTALVKDGAAAIRTLGSSADTTVKALNPGTTAGDVDYYTTSTAKARLGIGTTGQVLTVSGGVPSWVTPSAGGMDLLQTLTLSGASTVSSSIAGTYKNLQIIVRNFLPATDDTELRMRINGDTGTSYRSNDDYVGNTTSSAANSTSIATTGSNDNSVSNSLVKIEIPDYANSTTYKTVQNFALTTDPTTTANIRTRYTGGNWFNTNAITTVTFIASSGNITSGTALIYGVK